uniref:Uncharacterized protein n=1 Tax=Myripristis murdjan TaxID=586833 RepID=A0A668ASM7_9TELE
REPEPPAPSTKLEVASMFLVLCWWTWSQAPWTLSGLVPLGRCSDQTTLSLVRKRSS